MSIELNAKIQIKRGSGSPGTLLDLAELGLDTDNSLFYIGTGVGNAPIVIQSSSEISHSSLLNLNTDDHTQYILVTGTRSFTGKISYNVHPTFLADEEIVDKKYVDDLISGLTTDHGSLTGLGDDDHSQYILVDGTRDFSGKISYSTHPVFNIDTEIVDKKYVDDLISGLTTDHGSLTGLGDDDHSQYSLADGSRSFTSTVSYNTHPVFNADTELVDKKYVDDNDISTKDTNDLTEGTSNLYYTNVRVSANIDVSANTLARHSHANEVQLDLITNSGSGIIISTVERNKLSGISAGAEVNQTDSIIKTQYENNADTNVFTDSEKTKLSTLESSKFLGTYLSLLALESAHSSPGEGSYGHVDQGASFDVVVYIWDNNNTEYVLQLGESTSETAATIKSKYESNADTNAFTDLEKTKLLGIETAAEVNIVDSVNTKTGIIVLDSDDLLEGITNLYYTEDRVNTNFGTKTTTDLTEGTNLYHTEARVDARIAATNIDHGGLSGLVDDDHTQYTLADGTRGFSGKISYNTHPTFSTDTELVDKKYVDEALTVRDLANLQIERTTDFNATPSWANITFDQIDLVTEASVLYLDPVNTDRIRIDTTGTFVMACKVLPTNGTSQRYDIRLRINDTTIIPGSESFVDIYAGESHELTIACSFNASAGDYVSLQGFAENSGTFQANTGLSITKLDGVKGIDGVDGIDGADGIQGPPGSGTTINVTNEGTSLPNGPFDQISFIGPGVNVVENGSTAEVTVTQAVLPVYGTEWQLASETSITSSTATTEQTKVTLTTSSLPSGNYKLTAHWVGRHTPANSSAYFDVTQNGSPIGVVSEMEKEFKDVNNDEPMSRSYFLNLSGIQAFALRYWNEGGTVTISDAHLELIRTS